MEGADEPHSIIHSQISVLKYQFLIPIVPSFNVRNQKSSLFNFNKHIFPNNELLHTVSSCVDILHN